MRAMGYMDEPRRLAMLYAASDLFVGPSLEEAFGQVFIEAAACGTPSVGYPVGGKPEAIAAGVSGLLADDVTPAALAEAIETLYMDARLRRHMGGWARLWAEGKWSMSASMHRMHGVMRRQGLVDRLRMLPRLTLEFNPPAPPAPQAVAATVPAWRPVSGFDHWEGPYPDRGIARCRWAHGPVARFEVAASVAGPARLLISCRCFIQGQHIRVMQGRECVGECEVPVTPDQSPDYIAAMDLDLAPGANVLDIHSWHWAPGPRPMSILITSISALPRAEGRSSGVLVEPKPVLAAKP
jgi:hypothetical protein